MAFSGESAGLTWQRVKYYLDGGSSTGTTGVAKGASPGAKLAFEGLRKYLAQHKGNPQMQFTLISDFVNGSDQGNAQQIVTAGTSTLRGFYLKKIGAGTAKAYFKLCNHATVVQADSDVQMSATTTAAEIFATYLNGLALTTGIVTGTYTTNQGTATTTLSLQADSFAGFVLTTA